MANWRLLHAALDRGEYSGTPTAALLERVERLEDELEHWIKRATFAEQFIPTETTRGE